MDNRKLIAVVYGIAIALASVSSVYMYVLKAPSVVAARPELAEIGWWTALFSGRFYTWLYYHEPVFGIVLTFVVWLLLATGIIFPVVIDR